MEEIKTFLAEYNKELQQSPTSENVHPKIVGNYCLDREDVTNQVIDWVLHYLENRKCPYQLAVAIAKSTAKQINAEISSQVQENSDEQEKLLNSFALYTQTLKKLPIICNSFLDEVDDKMSLPYSPPFATSVFDIKNKRRTMEDRHVIHHDLNLLLDLKDAPSHSYYAVFDGHSGVDAASYASAHLHVNIANHPDFLTDLPIAISQSFKLTDEMFLKKCREENLKSGSTAICALVKENTVYLSWVGDSQAVLVKGGKPVLVTEPHKPDRPDEQKRIEDLGGTVIYSGVWRVNGMLAITRAFGDIDHRPFISSEPKITTINLVGDEDFLILACDGLWDGISPAEAAAALYRNLSENALEEPLDAVAAKLVHKSKEQGSEDNITAIVIFLRDLQTIKDYAVELLSHETLQGDFRGMNGDECHNHDNSPCVKPTVLELNSASAKKLKNTANVLSSTGFSYPIFTEGGLDAFQNTNENSIFVPHQNIATCFAPETTALSELPTPPIDEIVASQQFGNLCSADLLEGLNSISTQQSGLVEEETNAFNSGIFDSMVNVQPFNIENHVSPEQCMQNPFVNDITPDEAANVASCVVSSTIETAVKCLSSNELCESISALPATKLNPYAKPFIPSEFEATTKSEIVSDVLIDVKEEISPECNVSGISSTDKSFEEFENVVASENIVEKISETPFSSDNILKPIQNIEVASPIILAGLTSQFSELSIASPLCPSGAEIEVDTLIDQNCILDEQNNIKISSKLSNLQNKLSDVQDKMQENQVFSQNVFSETLQLPTEPAICPVESNVVKSSAVMEVLNNSAGNIEGICDFENLLEKEKRNSETIHIEDALQNKQNKTDKIVLYEISKSEVNSLEHATVIEDTVTENILDGLTAESMIPKKELSLDNPVSNLDAAIEQGTLADNISTASDIVGRDDQGYTETPNAEKDQSDNVQCKEPCDANLAPCASKEISPFKVSEASNVLESIAFGSLNIECVAEKFSSNETALPSDSADEGPVETVAVDLQAIPVGVPEAEGVTEDVDSDSEKDGGWSYMKGNIIGGSGKPKSEESKPKIEKSSTKLETVTKIKKDASKAIADNKTKVRNLTSSDKLKKPLLEKKILDVKEKGKPTRTLSATLPKDTSKSTSSKTSVEKTAKPLSTIARAKKEVPTTASSSKVSTVAVAKLSRPTTLRNPAAVSKPAATLNIERSGTTKTVSSLTTSNVRPKSALSTNGVKAPLRPTTLAKTQPPNQSKSNLAPTARSTTLARPNASTVPTRALSKPSTVSKPVPESKVKPVAPALKKVEPKKPGVKEAKDIVNKQILARKNTTTTSSITKSEATKSAATGSQRAMTLTNKPVSSKPRSAPVKADINKKDVPKSGTSRVATKAPLKKALAEKSSKEKANLVQEVEKNSNELAIANQQSSTKVTPTSEEEKFILEVNDKEVNHSDEKNNLVTQKINYVENGFEDIVPLEENLASANELECNAQNL